MRSYIIRRLLLILPTILGVTVITFLLLRFIPGDIVDLMIREAEFGAGGIGGGGVLDRDAVMQYLGLDAPMYIQYFRWLGAVPGADGSFSGILQGDLGISLWRFIPVAELIVARLPVTIELGILGILTILILGIPLGIYSALRQDTGGDYVGRGLATAAIAVPSFWLGILVLLASSLWFGYSPPIRAISFTKDPIGHLVQFGIPSVVIGMAGAGGTMRLMRSMMLEVLRQDYIRTAWAKGLSERVVIMRHALKNALIPVVTSAGLMVPAIVGGTVIIEIVFNLPGIGRLMVTSIAARDYPIVSGVVLIFSVVLVINNLIIDLTYAYLDPRIRYK